VIGSCGIDGCTHLLPEAATLDEGQQVGANPSRNDDVACARRSGPAEPAASRRAPRIVPDEDAMRNREILTVADIQRERLRAARTNDIPGRASTLQLAVVIRVRRAQRDFRRRRTA
jgi:hypothetical protein